MRKNDIYKLIICGIVVLFLIAFSIIKSFPESADFYTKHFSGVYVKFVGDFTSQIGFSIFEVGVILTLGLLIFLIVRIFTGIKKKKLTWLSRLLTLLTFTLCLTNLYIGTASVAYGRSPLDLPMAQNEEIDETTIEDALKHYVDEYNDLGTKFSRNDDGTIISPYTHNEISTLINDEYRKLSKITSYYLDYEPLGKDMIFSFLFSEFHLTGITMSITGEANINSWISSVEYPFTLAHEFAHAKGCYREDDANTTALYILMNSDNDYLKYCGLYIGIGALIDAYQTTYRVSYSEKYPLSNNILKERSTIYKFWEDHDALSDWADFWNDLYLKMNGNQNGTDDYNDVSTKEDTGKVDDQGNKIFKITNFSNYQKIIYKIYLSDVN
jgi:hypothetical protein